MKIINKRHECLSQKFLSSLKPSRHWGPRDPITHYYWLARREEDHGTAARNRYHRRYLNQLFELPASVIAPDSNYDALGNRIVKVDEKQQRTNSDDLVYTIFRRQYLKDNLGDVFDNLKQRPKSLDWDVPVKLHERAFKNPRATRSLGTRKQSTARIDIVVPVDVSRISRDPR